MISRRALTSSVPSAWVSRRSNSALEYLDSFQGTPVRYARARLMTPSGRWAQVVKPNGTLVQTSQYWVDGITLILTRIPASFHCSTIVCTASSSHAGWGRAMISTSMPFG